MFDQAALRALIYEKAPEIGQLKRLDILERGPGGRVMSLRLAGTKGVKTILYELPIRRFFNNLKSGTFTLNTRNQYRGTRHQGHIYRSRLGSRGRHVPDGFDWSRRSRAIPSPHPPTLLRKRHAASALQIQFA